MPAGRPGRWCRHVLSVSPCLVADIAFAPVLGVGNAAYAVASPAGWAKVRRRARGCRVWRCCSARSGLLASARPPTPRHQAGACAGVHPLHHALLSIDTARPALSTAASTERERGTRIMARSSGRNSAACEGGLPLLGRRVVASVGVAELVGSDRHPFAGRTVAAPAMRGIRAGTVLSSTVATAGWGVLYASSRAPSMAGGIGEHAPSGHLPRVGYHHRGGDEGSVCEDRQGRIGAIPAGEEVARGHRCLLWFEEWS